MTDRRPLLAALALALLATRAFPQCATATQTTSQSPNCLQTSGATTIAGAANQPTVYYQAGTKIDLLPGFDAKAGPSGAAFIAAIGPVITTTSLPPAIVGASYTAQLTAAEGTFTGLFAWTPSGPVNGLTLNASGVIFGTPLTAGTATFTAIATDAAGSPSLPQTLSITISPGVSVTTTSLPVGIVGSGYIAMLTASGGMQPYSWTLSSGSLPPGLTLNPSGAIGGSPSTVTGSPFTFAVKATDGNGYSSAAASLLITVSPAVSITTTSLPPGISGSSFSAGLTASGGIGPYTGWTVSAGALPMGLTLNSNGTIAGVPGASGNFNFTATVTDSETPAKNASQSLQLSIAPAPIAISTLLLPYGVAAQAYTNGIGQNVALKAFGGTPPYSWSLTGLPSALVLSAASGEITGKPATSGVYT